MEIVVHSGNYIKCDKPVKYFISIFLILSGFSIISFLSYFIIIFQTAPILNAMIYMVSSRENVWNIVQSLATI